MAITVGNVHVITQRHRENGVPVDESFEVVVTWAEQREMKHGPGIYFGYFPVGPDAWLHGSWGCAKVYEYHTTPFGVQRVQDTGRKYITRYERAYSPRPGDKGYDLMC